MWRVVIDPDSFFADLVEGDRILASTMIVCLAAVANVLGAILMAGKVVRVAPNELAGLVSVGYFIGVVAGAVTVFIMWVLYGVSFYAISRVIFDASGNLRDTLRATAWGFVPTILSGLVSAAVMTYKLQQVTLPERPGNLQPFIADLQASALFQLAGTLGIVFTLWSGFLWIFGVKHACELRERDAIIAVSIPLTVVLMFKIHSLL